MALSGITPPVMNWDSTKLPTKWGKTYTTYIRRTFKRQNRRRKGSLPK